MQVSTHDQDTPAANKQHKIEDQLPEYFNHGRILAPLAGIIHLILPEHRTPRQLLQFWAEVARDMSEAATIDISYLLNDHGRVVTEQNSLNENEPLSD